MASGLKDGGDGTLWLIVGGAVTLVIAALVAFLLNKKKPAPVEAPVVPKKQPAKKKEPKKATTDAKSAKVGQSEP